MAPRDADESTPGSAAADVVDRGLLAEAVGLQVAQNRAHAARLELMCRFHERRVAEVAAREAGGAGAVGHRAGVLLVDAVAGDQGGVFPGCGRDAAL